MKWARTVPNLAMQNAVANQQSVQSMVNAAMQNGLTMAQANLQSGLDFSRAVTARAVNTAIAAAGEAAAFEKTLGREISDQLSEINGALAGGQQSAKIANTTPPETGVASALATLAAGQAAIIELLRSTRPAP